MKSWDYEAVVFDAEIFCVECLPQGVHLEDEDVHPIFADSEWDYAPVCDRCGREHDYVCLINQGVWND